MAKILIVEDDADIHQLLEEILISESYQTRHAYSVSEALFILEKEKVDLILLDLMLPDLAGEEIISKIKDTPIVVLSAKAGINDKVECLNRGANDYIVKPFNKQELLARLNVQLRDKTTLNPSLKFKSLELTNHYTMIINNLELKLTKTEYAILKQLLLTPSQVITKSKLLDLISTDTLDGDENSLKVHISNIRKKIRKVSEEEYIESVWGIGFKMHE